MSVLEDMADLNGDGHDLVLGQGASVFDDFRQILPENKFHHEVRLVYPEAQAGVEECWDARVPQSCEQLRLLFEAANRLLWRMRFH